MQGSSYILRKEKLLNQIGVVIVSLSILIDPNLVIAIRQNIADLVLDAVSVKKENCVGMDDVDYLLVRYIKDILAVCKDVN